MSLSFKFSFVAAPSPTGDDEPKLSRHNSQLAQDFYLMRGSMKRGNSILSTRLQVGMVGICYGGVPLGLTLIKSRIGKVGCESG